MGKYWCKHCSIFVDENKIQKLRHESSGRHQRNISHLLKSLHEKNKNEKKDLKLAREELERINREIGGEISNDKPKKFIKVPKKIDKDNEQEEKSGVIGNWEPTTNSREEDTSSKDKEIVSNSKQEKVKTIGEQELNEWNLNNEKPLLLSSDSDSDETQKQIPPVIRKRSRIKPERDETSSTNIKFKKRKILK
ncbi:hypothetical protein PACTADRAFT_35979 [Pachysolen tannophilus NRRL Y-2460]|uniref:U1-type domain-containing protein n=1 Tax=Pachysolen tannophilus NRRL Y-2460 TaxID=669874 RepID=A0A1E4TNM7_PACTA|nr:hypothetical protein PACTADRAFT_35979 [Pachysolen tannophilus NRRL Y-2460]